MTTICQGHYQQSGRWSGYWKHDAMLQCLVTLWLILSGNIGCLMNGKWLLEPASLQLHGGREQRADFHLLYCYTLQV
jgi:hypothetical protein